MRFPPRRSWSNGNATTRGRDRDFYSTLRRQAQLTVLAFKTGVAVSADLWLGGFDTHATHDPDHEWLLANLTDSVDYLWEYAEEHGVADRMVVVIGSDFGRTNFYNAQSGKDHWPIGSFIVMEKYQRWTGRAVGETDGLHFAQRINPRTLRRDDTNGTIIYPKHVHKALAALPRHRAHAGCAALPLQQHRGLRVLRVSRRLFARAVRSPPPMWTLRPPGHRHPVVVQSGSFSIGIRAGRAWETHG